MIARRLSVAILAAGVARAGRAGAQSTETLGSYERLVQFQLSVAMNSAFIGSRYGQQTGTLRAIDVATHVHAGGAMLVRLDAWAIGRRPYASQDNYGGHLTRSFTFALVGSGEFPLHLPEDVSISPAISFGWVPYASGTFDRSQTGAPVVERRSSTGLVYGVALALRWRHVVIEQHMLQINGADRALKNGETAPLSFGLRF